MVDLVAVVMIFSIPLTAIITTHSRKQTRLKQSMLADQLELEKVKQENFLIETEKLRLELEQMRLEEPKKDHQFLIK
ncbi:hypothetical protein [Planomicrobium sp. YIM 101495]|uniref:hypothetical protein n=1 Tax=Planomicrobium sp. YIM 101495 TaxID=2665160 RepID=UPI0012B98004|nr:hypothetical protein [Planomicrobium sp. YIM 101495]MTD31508.1 hypothetical protein [Planomicrobium sp. YIM 101495]